MKTRSLDGCAPGPLGRAAFRAAARLGIALVAALLFHPHLARASPHEDRALERAVRFLEYQLVRWFSPRELPGYDPRDGFVHRYHDGSGTLRYRPRTGAGVASFDFSDPRFGTSDQRLYLGRFKRAMLYDQALAVIAFCMTGRHDLARDILRHVASLQNPDGSIGTSWNLEEGFYDPQRRVGAMAWFGYACVFYQRVTGRREFEAVATRLANHILDHRQRLEDGNLCLAAGWGRYDAATWAFRHEPAPWSAVEHMIDAFFFMRDLGATLDRGARYAAVADSLAVTLRTSFWRRHPDYWSERLTQSLHWDSAGWEPRDDDVPLDAAAWGCMFFLALGDSAARRQAENSWRQAMLFRCSDTVQGRRIEGFGPYQRHQSGAVDAPLAPAPLQIRPGPPSGRSPAASRPGRALVWSEGTLSVVAAAAKLGESRRAAGVGGEGSAPEDAGAAEADSIARRYLAEMIRLQGLSRRGGLLYATHDSTDFIAVPSVAGAAWLVIAIKVTQDPAWRKAFWGPRPPMRGRIWRPGFRGRGEWGAGEIRDEDVRRAVGTIELETCGSLARSEWILSTAVRDGAPRMERRPGLAGPFPFESRGVRLAGRWLDPLPAVRSVLAGNLLEPALGARLFVPPIDSYAPFDLRGVMVEGAVGETVDYDLVAAAGSDLSRAVGGRLVLEAWRSRTTAWPPKPNQRHRSVRRGHRPWARRAHAPLLRAEMAYVHVVEELRDLATNARRDYSRRPAYGAQLELQLGLRLTMKAAYARSIGRFRALPALEPDPNRGSTADDPSSAVLVPVLHAGVEPVYGGAIRARLDGEAYSAEARYVDAGRGIVATITGVRSDATFLPKLRLASFREDIEEGRQGLMAEARLYLRNWNPHASARILDLVSEAKPGALAPFGNALNRASHLADERAFFGGATARAARSWGVVEADVTLGAQERRFRYFPGSPNERSSADILLLSARADVRDALGVAVGYRNDALGTGDRAWTVTTSARVRLGAASELRAEYRHADPQNYFDGRRFEPADRSLTLQIRLVFQPS